MITRRGFLSRMWPAAAYPLLAAHHKPDHSNGGGNGGGGDPVGYGRVFWAELEVPAPSEPTTAVGYGRVLWVELETPAASEPPPTYAGIFDPQIFDPAIFDTGAAA